MFLDEGIVGLLLFMFWIWAVLDVISSDLATSWGKTPRWLFIDEICNHDGTEGAKGFFAWLDGMLERI